MREIIVIPRVVDDFVATLNGLLVEHGVETEAYSELPEERPLEFINVSQLSTSRVSIAHAIVTIVVECCSMTQADADRLAEITYALGTSIDGLSSGAYVPLHKGTVSGPQPSVDTSIGLPRSVFSLRLVVPARVL